MHQSQEDLKRLIKESIREVLIPGCVQVEVIEKSGEVTSPGPPSPRK